MKTLPLSALIYLIIFCGCKKTDEVKINDDALSASLSKEISDIVNISKSSLILPASDDFSSIPQDPQNPLTADKVALGKLLFHETKLGGNPKVQQGIYTYSCASCHHAEAGFQSGLAQAIGEGGIGFGLTGEGRVPSGINQSSVDVQPFKTPTALNIAYQDNVTWSGGLGATGVNVGTQNLWKGKFQSNNLGFEGIETQAFAGQTVHRLKVDTAWFLSNATYKDLFDRAFASLPQDQRISPTTVAFAIAAYERTLLANEAPFQKWLKGNAAAMTREQKQGAQLFFGKAGCGNCHAGPALNSMAFFALGVNDLQNGEHGAINIPANNIQLGRGDFTKADSDKFKFKVPQLYNLKDVKFFGHGASFGSVTDMVKYINNGVAENNNVPASQLAKQFKPLGLTDDEINKVVKFIEDALYDPNLLRYEPTSVPSGFCIPNNDPKSRKDRGCD